MATYLYCLLGTTARAADLAPGFAGISGAPVREIRVSREGVSFAAWVSTLDEQVVRQARGSAAASLALAHNAVADGALSLGWTPLPARFGQWFADDDACRADLEARALVLHAALARIAGCVEMSILLAPATQRVGAPAVMSPPRAGEPDAGRRYLEYLRERARRDDELRAAADVELARVGAATTHLVRLESRRRDPSGVSSLSHLIPRDAVGEYRAAVEAVEVSGPFRRIVAGPRAPYSFADDESAAPIGHDSGSLINND